MFVFPSSFCPFLYHWYVRIPSTSPTVGTIFNVLFIVAYAVCGIVTFASCAVGNTTLSFLRSSFSTTSSETKLAETMQLPSFTSL